MSLQVLQEARPPSVRNAFYGDVSQEFLTDSLRGLISAAESASRTAQNEYSVSQLQKYIFPQLRLCNTEAELSAIATKHGYLVHVRPNAGDNYSYHEIRAGRVVLTVSHVGAFGEVPRSAHFRNSLAWSAQLTLKLFDTDEPTVSENGDCLYAILAHGGEGTLPTFAFIGFLDSSGKHWVDLIDLGAQLHQLLPRSIATEVIDDESEVQLKERG